MEKTKEMSKIGGYAYQKEEAMKIINFFNKIFKTKKECNEYIKSNLDPKEYVAEDFMIDEKYYGIKGFKRSNG